MDEILHHWNDDAPVNINKRWTASKWCERISISQLATVLSFGAWVVSHTISPLRLQLWRIVQVCAVAIETPEQFEGFSGVRLEVIYWFQALSKSRVEDTGPQDLTGV